VARPPGGGAFTNWCAYLVRLTPPLPADPPSNPTSGVWGTSEQPLAGSRGPLTPRIWSYSCEPGADDRLDRSLTLESVTASA